MSETPDAPRRTLGATDDAFADDDGRADPGLRERLAAAEASRRQDDYFRAVAELCLTRVLVPIVATGDEHGGDATGPNPDRQAEMSAVMLQHPDGRRAMLCFTGVDALTAWNPRARPVPATLDKVAEACGAAEAGVLLVDLEGPHPLVIEDELLAELARGHRLAVLDDDTFAWLSPGRAPGQEPG